MKRWWPMLFVATAAFAESWHVAGGGAHFDLQRDDTRFSFRGRSVVADFPVRACNQNLIDNFMRGLRRPLHRAPADARSPMRLTVDGKHAGVQLHSPLAHALRLAEPAAARLRVAARILCSQ